jgi:drug/metabolite transporter (DMT)-like permease
MSLLDRVLGDRATPRSIAMVLGAAACWGSLGTGYTLILGATALTPLELVTVRAIGATVLLLTWCALRQPRALRVRPRELGELAIFGLLTVTGFYAVLILAFRCAGVAVATVLLYLAPAIVTLGAAVVYQERLTGPRLLALGGALVGAALVAGIHEPARLQASQLGVLAGLASAVGYALYSLLGKRAMRRHPPATVLLYNLGIGSLGLLLLIGLLGNAPEAAGGSCEALGLRVLVAPTSASVPPTLPQLAGIGLLTGTLFTLAPLSLYLLALRDLPAGVASTLATAEPVVALLLAWAVLAERLDPIQIVGAALILGGVLVLAVVEGRRPDQSSR